MMNSSAAISEIRHVDTLILGAGISGLACALKLFQHPHYQAPNRLLVLEGRSRIGGRIGSVEVNGNRLDTGANWIHGTGTEARPNPLMKILPKKRLKQLSGGVSFKAPDENDAQSDIVDDDWVHVSRPARQPLATKSQIIPASIASTLATSLFSLLGALHEISATTSPDKAKNITMQKAITRAQAFQSAFEKLPKEYHKTFGSTVQFVEGIEAAPLVAQSAEHFKDRAGMGLLEYAIDDYDGEQVFVQDGYIPLVNEVAKELVAADAVKLNTSVEQIEWSHRPIVVETVDGTKYSANTVINTLPLGVLQHASSSLFHPPLPAEKQEAIDSTGYGTLDKIFMVYKDPWWNQEPYSSFWKPGMTGWPCSASPKSPDRFMTFTAELPGIEIHPDGSTSTGACSLFIINLQNLCGFPVLSCFVSCATARQVEGMSDLEAGDIVHRALTRGMGREPPEPEAVHVTRWAQDEFSRGSYSHMIAGLTETRHRVELAQPVFNEDGAVLRFAGEHTSRNHFATVHGALLSGWREADAILQSKSS